MGEVAYRITIPSKKKSKDKIADKPEPKPSQEDGWCLTHTIQLEPDQAQQFVSILDIYSSSPKGSSPPITWCACNGTRSNSDRVMKGL